MTLRDRVKWINGNKGCAYMMSDKSSHPDVLNVFIDNARANV